ncbi:hypothetical protein N0V87_005517 [Didymella glomerata]|jgi:hypothetical protein|uniref:Uncharacterized protein n=1 Tax=Didymella glomerata TaxID=749621 RepID=A0A9W8WYQ5_9PLEO|nr:hypothetical protein N0V87_005517 [Didymella glomerata]
MFKGPYDPIFGPAEPRQPRYHRRSYKTYTSSYSDEITPYSSFEDVRNLALTLPTGPRVTETRLAYRPQLTDLPSRVDALSRRGAMLSTYLAHLASVMEPLTNKKIDDVGERELRDIIKEGRGLGDAMSEFEEQYEEVRELMTDLMREKRDVLRRLDGDERGWTGGKARKDDF